MQQPGRFGKLKLILFIVTATLGCSAAGQVDTGDRIKVLERQIKTMSQDLDALKAHGARGMIESAPEVAPQVSSSPAARLENGLVFEDPQGDWRLRLTSRVLGDFRAFSPDAVAADTFALRQARLGAQVSVGKDYAAYVEGEYSGSSAILTNAYLDLAWYKVARIRVGQFKPSFGLEHTDRVPYFDFTERGLTASLIQNALFDRGISVFGEPAAGLFYAVSLSNGTGQNIDERGTNVTETTSDGKDLTARIAMNFAEVADWKDGIVHLGGSYRTGEQANSTSSPFTAATAATEGRGITFFAPEAFNTAGGSASAIDRSLAGAEAILAFGWVKLQSEYMQASYAGTRYWPSAVDFDRRIDAGYVSATWLLTGESYRDAYSGSMITKIRPRAQFIKGATGHWGAIEAGVRYSWFDASDFSDANPANTGRLSATGPASNSSPKAAAVTFGLKWILNTNIRFLLDYIQTRFDTPLTVGTETIDHENAVNLRAQFDLF